MFGHAPGFEIGQSADRAQQMLVDGVMMVHVELHQRDDLAEFRDEAPEHAGFIHQPQHDFRLVARRQNAEKQPIGLGVGAQIGVDQAQGQRDRAHSVGMDRQTIAIGDPEEPDEVDRIALEDLGVDDRDATVIDDEIALRGAAAAAPERRRKRSKMARAWPAFLRAPRRRSRSDRRHPWRPENNAS